MPSKPLLSKITDKFRPKADVPIPVNMFNFDTLIKETIKTAIKLIEYFRLNLIYYQLVSGKGLEFDRLIEYVPGHDPRRIDWKVFARSGKLFIRAFKEERQFDIIVVIDVSDSMLLGTASMTKNEYAAIVAGALAYAASEAGDEVGLTMISDKVNLATAPSSEYFKMMSYVADKENYGGKKDWNQLHRTLVGNYSPNSILFIISDFIDTDPQMFLPELSANFSKVYGVMVRDPIDNELPKGVGRMYLQDIKGSDLFLTNFDKYREEYALLAKRQVQAIANVFHTYDQLFFKINTGEDFASGFINALGGEEVILL